MSSCASSSEVHYVDAFMLEALREAAVALAEGEVPVGCVLVRIDTNEHFNSFQVPLCDDTPCSNHDNSTSNNNNARSITNDDRSAESVPARTHEEAEDGTVAMKQLTPPLLSRGRNATNRLHHALAHAELVAAEALSVYSAQQQQQQQHHHHDGINHDDDGKTESTAIHDLSAYVLYVTVEPCVMCAAFLLYHRIRHVFFGCANPRFGGNGTVLALNDPERNNFSGYLGTSTMTETAASSSMMMSGTSCGYPSEGGHRADEAIHQLQAFYGRENPNAPGHKRRRKPPVSSSEAGSE